MRIVASWALVCCGYAVRALPLNDCGRPTLDPPHPMTRRVDGRTMVMITDPTPRIATSRRSEFP
jgi:hypothetical protein